MILIGGGWAKIFLRISNSGGTFFVNALRVSNIWTTILGWASGGGFGLYGSIFKLEQDFQNIISELKLFYGGVL